ncbi:hypothetical protein FRC01_003165 [Tulasnella sp. 417]|nr:hypothetical protein FRC01_003165 [Tulasnella sp. 417]
MPPRNYGAITTPSQASVALGQTQADPSQQHSQHSGDEPWRAKVLITGLRRSGKTSVQEVVFNSLPPKDSFFLEATSKITKLDIDSMVAFQLWDCPGSREIEDLGVPLSYFQSIIFVLDIQDDYYSPIAHLVHLIATVAEVNPKVHLEVFVHKAEALSDEFKVEHFRHIQSRIIDELLDHPASSIMTNLPLNFYLTSVYDHTIYEAFSRVVQRLVPQLPTLENLLNTLVANSGIAKAFLFDVTCLLYVATDASPVDNASFELCCDYVQTLTSFSNLYKNLRVQPPASPISTDPAARPTHSPEPSTPSSPSNASEHHPMSGGTTGPRKSRPKAPRKQTQPEEEESPASSPSHSLISTSKAEGEVAQPAGGATLRRNGSQKSKTGSNGSAASNGTGSKTLDRLLPLDTEPKRWASSSAKLTPESTLAYWQITDTLSLVCLIRSQTYEERRGLIEYNVTFFRGAVQKIVQLEMAKRNR